MQYDDERNKRLETFDPVRFLQEIVAIDSCDPPGGEREIAYRIGDVLSELGLESEIDEFMPGRANVIGRLRGTGERPNLVLSAHMDTVPVGTVPWHSSPFSGEIKDGRLYGRGSSDMKSALAAMIGAMEALSLREIPLKGDVVLALTAGESANLLGARRLVEKGFQSEIGAFLCGEPSGLDVVIAEKAVLWLRVTATGRLGHVSGNAGVNAILLVNDFLTRLKGFTLSCPTHPLLDAPTIRVGRIDGGSAVNLTPDRCCVDLDLRFPPNVHPSEIVRQVSDLMGADLSIEILDHKPAVESLPDDDFVRLCQAASQDVCGRRPAMKGVSYYSDAAVLLDGLQVPFAILGPGDLGMSGQPNESVPLANVMSAVRIYTRIAEGWLA
ncbi:succinyl-diaminopimelate desuccinylase [Rhizobium sp. NFR07]|uniref:M20 family metallopeptidase n=1 Tax=Rhizobium sp. NFR07 TaxID=1566262 RepID=UPI0008E05557|nr:M20 family metallopeptidase [Rhizobium sp. NFR07]SFB63022.1 succinyl-diaminopimelate desuccinylase [Rhizobium sp. NFR07]